MRLVSLAIKNPISGFNFIDRHQYSSKYRCTEEFLDEFCKDNDFTLNYKECEFIGSALLLHLDLKSNYAINHPESNQASYSAEVVMIKD